MTSRLGLLILPTALVLGLVIHARAFDTHPADVPSTNSSLAAGETNADKVLPHLGLAETGIADAIDYLANVAGCNCLIAPQLEDKWAKSGMPKISFTLTNVTAKDALVQMLKLRHITLLEDPVSNIAFVVPDEQAGNPLFAGMATNHVAEHTNLLPLIQFSDVPISTAIENLARQEDINYIVDPKLAHMWVNPAPGKSEPQISLRAAHVTGWAMLNRMLAIRFLVLVDDPVTHVSRITFSGGRPPVDVDASLLDGAIRNSSANTIIPLIQFSSVPLDDALQNLIKQCGATIQLDPLLSDYSDPQNQPPTIDLRWTNLTARQAIIALCKNYGLVLVKNSTTGVVQIKPFEVKKRHS